MGDGLERMEIARGASRITCQGHALTSLRRVAEQRAARRRLSRGWLAPWMCRTRCGRGGGGHGVRCGGMACARMQAAVVAGVATHLNTRKPSSSSASNSRAERRLSTWERTQNGRNWLYASTLATTSKIWRGPGEKKSTLSSW